MKKEDRHSGYFTFDQFESIPHNIYGIGISPELLLNSTAQFYEMNEILRKEFQVVKEKFPESKIHWKISAEPEDFEKKLSILNCNYITPRNGWVESLESKDEKSVSKYISRASSLFAYRVLNPWVSSQLIEGLLKCGTLQQSLNFLETVIIIFSNILKDSCQQYKDANYFSFLFNQFQIELDRHYQHSVSAHLLINGLPINFLMNYFLHEHNEAARNDFFIWGIQQGNFYPIARQKYNAKEIKKFKNIIITGILNSYPSNFFLLSNLIDPNTRMIYFVADQKEQEELPRNQRSGSISNNSENFFNGLNYDGTDVSSKSLYTPNN